MTRKTTSSNRRTTVALTAAILITAFSFSGASAFDLFGSSDEPADTKKVEPLWEEVENPVSMTPSGSTTKFSPPKRQWN